MSIRLYLFSILTILLSQPATAQEAGLSGKVVDNTSHPIANAVIRLMRDSSNVKTALADSSGRFHMQRIPYGSYKLLIGAIGYTQLIIDKLELSTTHNSIDSLYMLDGNSHELKGVSITARKPYIEQKIDRTVLNVDALLSNAGLNVLEVLENAPAVVVSGEGDISLKGKSGVSIYIDDKPTYLSGNELANYLRSLPSSIVDKIELMPNPPARYDAAGNAGIINIRTKKTKSAGFNAGINLSYNQGIYARSYNSLNFNYRNKKLNIFGNGGYNIDNGYNDLDIYRYYYHDDGGLKSTFFQNSFIRRKSNAADARLGIDYALSSKSTIGILGNGSYRPGNTRTLNKSVVADGTGSTDSIITADNREWSKWQNGGLNLNYLYRHNDNTQLSADLDYIVYSMKQDQTFLNGIYGPDNSFRSTDGLTGKLPSHIDIYSAKTDYTHGFKWNGRIDAGAKVSYINTDNATNYSTVINGDTAVDYDKTNHFLYRETISAAYLNFSKDWSRFSIQAGLRMENTNSDGHQLGNAYKPDSSFKRNYTNLFPTLYLLYKLDTMSNNQLAFSYGRRIDRPYYQDLNPFISPLDKFSVYVGNPYLRPSFTNVFELSHIFKNKITTTLGYSIVTDISEETIDLSNSIYVSRPANIGRSTVLALNVSGAVDVAKWWTVNFYTDFQRRYYKGLVYNYPLDTASFYFGINLSNQFTLGKGWSAELSGMYRTGLLIGQIISGQTGRLNVVFAKKMLDNKLSVKVAFRDILRTGLNHGVITSIQGAYATYHNWGDSRNVAIAVGYNIGGKAKAPRQRSSGAEMEQGRVK